jgi:hypothetical protein
MTLPITEAYEQVARLMNKLPLCVAAATDVSLVIESATDVSSS